MEGLKRIKTRGLTLIEVLIGSALMLIIFAGIFGVIQMAMKMVGQSKARVTATALANQKIESARNLPYDSVGTSGGIPDGVIAETETILRNGVNYTVKNSVLYVDDAFDDVFPDDPLAWDYKRVKVKVSWSGNLAGEVNLQTDITPNGIETTGTGGIISVLVIDASGQPVTQADVQIENASSLPPINVHYQTNDQGRLFVPGAPACNDCYKITATKAGYSTERTYASGELIRGVALARPNIPYLSVLEGDLSEISFTIDRLAAKTVQTLKYIEEITWNDSFDDETKISEKFQTLASSTLSAAILQQQDGQYLSSGYIVSATTSPSGLDQWGRFSFNDDEPAGTDLKYQIYFTTGALWQIVPDAVLPGNAAGFNVSPVDLSALEPALYPKLKIRANFSSSDPTQTPGILDWQLSWFSSDTQTPVPNLAFLMQGVKTLGLDSSGEPIYKYSENLSTDAGGQIVLLDIEWDSYRITVSASTGYDIANSLLPQPVNLNPGASQTTVLRLANHSDNSLLVSVKDAGGQSLAGASARLYKASYDKTKLTTDSGQAFFGSLTAGTSTLDVSMSGFSNWSQDIYILGQTEQAAVMTVP